MRHVILHGHIFKNAGTTLDWSLRRCFGNGFLDHRDDERMISDGRDELRRLVMGDPGLNAVSSHHMSGDYPDIPGVAFLPVFILRHPIARMRSVYDFERQQQADTPGARAAKEKNFRDYVRWRMQPDVRRTIRNYQTMYLAGQRDFCSDRAIAEQCFPRALEALGTAAGVGIVERYDESMVVLEESLKVSLPGIDLAYEAQNVSGALPIGKNVDGPVADVLEELGGLARQVIDENSLDLALYQLGREQLQSRIDRIPDFAAKLHAFRSRLTDAL